MPELNGTNENSRLDNNPHEKEAMLQDSAELFLKTIPRHLVTPLHASRLATLLAPSQRVVVTILVSFIQCSTRNGQKHK
jgi:hypothetical protein